MIKWPWHYAPKEFLRPSIITSDSNFECAQTIYLNHGFKMLKMSSTGQWDLTKSIQAEILSRVLYVVLKICHF